MQLYAIQTLPDNTIHHGKVFTTKALAIREIEQHDCALDVFGNVLDNGTKVGKLVNLTLRVE